MKRVVDAFTAFYVQPTINTLQLKNAKAVISSDQSKSSIVEGRRADQYI